MYYKLVHKDKDGSLRSICVSGAAKVIYKPGEFVTAPPIMASLGYHLMVYDNLRNMFLDFFDLEKYDQVWECECLEHVPLPKYGYDSMSLDAVARGYDNTPPDHTPWSCIGALMFKQVKLTRRLKKSVFNKYKRDILWKST